MAHYPLEQEKGVQLRNPSHGNIDRLSALPDHVLCHILSFLRTEDAAATSVLSTRWRNLFISLPDSDLTFSKGRLTWARIPKDKVDGHFSPFLDFALRVIVLRNGASIRKFRLFVGDYVESFKFGIYSLISAALLCKVRELDIQVPYVETKGLAPSMIFTLDTLVSLKLERVGLVLPDLVSLPNLKMLSLEKFILVGENTFRKLLQGCPLLEELTLSFVRLNRKDGVLDISSPSMKKLLLECKTGEFTVVLESNNLARLELWIYCNNKICLNAPNLKYLIYYGQAVSMNFIQNLQSLVEAKVVLSLREMYSFGRRDVKAYDFRILAVSMNTSFDLSRCQRGFQLISALTSVRSLELLGSCLHALRSCQQLLPTFENLTALRLDPCHEEYGPTSWWEMISNLLESAPNVEVLIFPCVNRYNEKLGCVLPKAFPACFIQHLKEIKIEDFGIDEGCGNDEDQFKLVEHFLKNGKSLRKITLCKGPSLTSWSDCCNRILPFEKSSVDCQIVFDEMPDEIWYSDQ